MIPLCVPNISGNEGKYLAECVSSTFVSTIGPFVTQFEKMVAEAAGARGAVATSSGTTALHAALVAVGVERDDLVICPSLTFIASANAISHAGATPWLFDVDQESWTLDPALLARELASRTERRGGDLFHSGTGRRVSAIVPVFTLGIPADMDAIVAIAREYGLKIVVDGAAALGALYKGRTSGALGADLTMYSFNGNKTTTAGGGGGVAGDDEALLARFRHLTTTGRVGADYDHDIVAFNYRMTNLQAAVGCAQMERLDEFVAAKRRIAARYEDAFRGLNGISRFPDPEWATSPAWFSGFVFHGQGAADKSRALRAHLRQEGIDARPFWKPMHDQKPYADAPRTAMPVADALWPGVVTLPCSTHLTGAEQDKVIATVRGWFRG